MLAKSTGGATVKAGGDTWYFITADYAFGHALERDTSNFVKAAGGKVLGAVRTPFPATTDFSAFLLQAQAAQPKVIGFANAGPDTINCVKQAAEFGVTKRGIKLAALLMFITDVHSIGLQTGQGLVCSETFYWDLNDRTRAFTKRVLPKMPNLYPEHDPCRLLFGDAALPEGRGGYGRRRGQGSGHEVVNRMKAMPTDDDAFGPGSIRIDGRKIAPPTCSR